MIEFKNQTLVIGGQSKLPRELFGQEILQMEVELDIQDGQIIEISVTPSLPVVDRFLRKRMIGLHLESEIETARSTIQKELIFRGRKAILSALSDIVRQYGEYERPLASAPENQSDSGLL
jgi:hypothetical protein